MGQAKERKARLGKWYGHPIGPGHPDFVPPKKPEPSESSSDERSAQEEPNTPPQRPVRTITNRRRVPLLFSALAVAMVGMSSIPEPEYQPKKR